MTTNKSILEGRTNDSFGASAGNALGVLTILQSDDLSMLNRRFEITNPVTNLGRKADNDVIFASDSPVSRRHAVIETVDGQLFLKEILTRDDYTGQLKRPVYGTFVNGLRVNEPVKLRDGDIIVLGKRVRIRFEAAQIAVVNGERTLDQIDGLPDAKTIVACTEDKTVISAQAENVESPGPDAKTLLAFPNQKARDPGCKDSRRTPGDKRG